VQGLGDLAGARERQERALQIFQAAYGPDNHGECSMTLSRPAWPSIHHPP